MEQIKNSKFLSLTKQELGMSKFQLYNYINTMKIENNSLSNKINEINNSLNYCYDLIQKLKTASSDVSISKNELEKFFQVNSNIANTEELDNIINKNEELIRNINNNVIPKLNEKINNLKNNINSNSSHIQLLYEYCSTLE